VPRPSTRRRCSRAAARCRHVVPVSRRVGDDASARPTQIATDASVARPPAWTRASRAGSRSPDGPRREPWRRRLRVGGEGAPPGHRARQTLGGAAAGRLPCRAAGRLACQAAGSGAHQGAGQSPGRIIAATMLSQVAAL
jgi:hypothetical protein